MDNRGTGGSGAIDCPELQTAEKWTVELIGACGRSLGHRAALYGTAYAADDLAAILEAARESDRIDLYGDSYGTYFEQVFALRHPAMLRSIVLDGAYPLDGPDYAWYPSYAPAMRDKFNIACRRSAACDALPGSSIEHISPRSSACARIPSPRAPPTATARSAPSRRAHRNSPSSCSQPLRPSRPYARSMPPRARSRRRSRPLLRLMAETASAVDSRDPTANPAVWSAGLAAAVMCQDPPQIFDMGSIPTARIADRDRALAERRRTAPDTYAPFTIDEFRGMPLDYSFLDQCVEWPVAPASHPASAVTALDAPYPDVPALVISGELDDITTPADGAAVAAAFKHGRQVLIANSFHVNALPRARSPCAAGIVRRFIATLDPGDVGCAAQVPPLRLVPRFALRIEELEPARPLAGNSASELELRAASAAVMTAGDVLVRARSNSSGHGVGLRGGSFEISARPRSTRIVLRGVRWTSDLAVSGTIDDPHEPAGAIAAHLRIDGPGGMAGRLEVRWQDEAPDARAAIQGAIDGTRSRRKSRRPSAKAAA